MDLFDIDLALLLSQKYLDVIMPNAIIFRWAEKLKLS